LLYYQTVPKELKNILFTVLIHNIKFSEKVVTLIGLLVNNIRKV